jgi:hypothetical protein
MLQIINSSRSKRNILSNKIFFIPTPRIMSIDEINSLFGYIILIVRFKTCFEVLSDICRSNKQASQNSNVKKDKNILEYNPELKKDPTC